MLKQLECGLYREHTMVLSKITSYLLQDGWIYMAGYLALALKALPNGGELLIA